MRAILRRRVERLILGLDIAATVRRVSRLWALAVARGRWVRGRLRRASGRVMGALEGLLARAGRAGRVTAACLSLVFPLAVAGVRIGTVAGLRHSYLWYPPRWDAVRIAPVAATRSEPSGDVLSVGMGGASEGAYPLRIMTYTARPGDTLGGIAVAFRLELDTVSSLNRVMGNGVHVVSVGERLKIPNQNGIYLPLNGTLEEMARQYDLVPETVLAINELEAPALKPGMQLFFPVQHSGSMRAIIEGNAFFYPLVGWWDVASGYGWRRDPFDASGPRRVHYGIDFAGALGAPVYAAREGTVWLASQDTVFGNQVLIGHERGLTSFYAHLQSIAVRPGQHVSSSTVIGRLGATGKVTGPHLHFEIRINGMARDPMGYLARRP